jgi:hypothetical protein
LPAVTRRLSITLAAVLVLAGLGAPPAALAKRPPTHNERVAIIRALPADLRAYPADCVQFTVAVSGTGRFATATPEVLIPRPSRASDPCLRYAGDGYFVLRKTGRWRIVFTGSELPACSLGVPRDLTRCLP